MLTRREWVIALIAVLIGIGLTRAYDEFVIWLDIDTCLDSGGRWNERTDECERQGP